MAAAGLLGPLSQFTRLHPLVEALYNRPVGAGWGLVLSTLGFGIVATVATFRAVTVDRPVTVAEGGLSHDRRKALDMDENKGIVFYGTAWCPDCLMARRVLDQQAVSYKLKDIDKDPAAAGYVKQVNRGLRSVPTIVFPDGSILVEPSRTQLREKLSAIA